MEQGNDDIDRVAESQKPDGAGPNTDQQGEEHSTSTNVTSQGLSTKEVSGNVQRDGSMTLVPPRSGDQMDTQPCTTQELDVYGQSPVASVQSGASGDTELGSPLFEEPLTPATDNSSSSKSQPGSGRVTPASQSDQSLYMSSAEKGTPARKRRLTESGARQIDFDNQSNSSGSIRNARAPFRLGISWRKGERLEAMDFMHKWFPAKIREINAEELTVLIHFDGWNQRFDEWVAMASDRIRPLIRQSGRKERSRKQKDVGEYKIGEQVYAKWSDCKMYPAKVTGVLPNGSYEVIFYDGFKKQIQPINLRPMVGEVKSKAFEVSPDSAGAPKKAKVKLECATVTSPTDHQIVTSPPRPKAKKVARSRSRVGTKQRSRKNKVIPIQQFVPKEILLKGDGTGPGPTPEAVLSIKSEPVSTQTEYAEPKQVEIKVEPSTSEFLPIPTVAVSEPLPPVVQAEVTYVKPEPASIKPQERALPLGPAILAPKAFVVESDHNHFKCHFEGCYKSFRKEHLLEYHIKYYHIDGAEVPPPQPQKKRRKTTSSTELESTAMMKKSGCKKPRTSSADCLQLREIKQEIKQEVKEEIIDEAPIPMLTVRVKQETGEISTQTMLVQQEVVEDSLGADLETLQQHAINQDSPLIDSGLTEESSVTDMEEYLKPDELVNCICDYYEENGLMIQCEVCLCWQHASCFGITERTLPKTYVCFVCENPPGVRESSRYIHEQDWFKCGEIAAFNYLPNINGSEERCGAIKQTHSLVAEIHQLNTVLHSLKLQLKILKTKDEEKLKLWRMDWDVTETFQDDDDHLTPGMATASGAPYGSGTLNVEPPKVVFTLDPGEEEGDKTKTLGEETAVTNTGDSQKGGEAIMAVGEGEGDGKQETKVDTAETVTAAGDVGTSKTGDKNDETPTVTATDSATEIANQMMSPAREEKEIEESTHSDSTESVVEDPTEMYERNLLNHIQRVQNEIDARMDKIEEDISMLESMEAMGSRRGPPATDNVTADMPHLKRTMRSLHNDLYKIKKMAVFH